MTVAPAATMDHSPILMPGINVAPAPIQEPLATWMLARRGAWGEMWTMSASLHSWSMEGTVLTIQGLQIFASDWMIAPCMTTVPGPMDAYLEIIADGWTEAGPAVICSLSFYRVFWNGLGSGATCHVYEFELYSSKALYLNIGLYFMPGIDSLSFFQLSYQFQRFQSL